MALAAVDEAGCPHARVTQLPVAGPDEQGMRIGVRRVRVEELPPEVQRALAQASPLVR